MTFKNDYSKKRKEKNKKPLTDQGWLILKLFIIREGQAQLYFKRFNYNLSDMGNYHPPDHFYSYSRDIEQHLASKITHQTAINWCKKFKEIEIFESVERRTENKAYQKNQQYFLRSDLDTFKKVIGLVIQQCEPNERLEILSTDYFQNKIDDVLVRQILSKKGVSTLTRIDTFDWNPEEFKSVLAYWNGLKDVGSIEKYIEDVQNQIREYEEIGYNKWYFIPYGQIIIPVLPDLNEEEDISLFDNAINEPDREDSPIIPVSRYHSILRDHKQITEYENLILPILCLIKISPKALDEFVNGQWDGFKMNLGLFSKPEEKKHYPFFINLFMIAMNDISLTLKIPSNSLVRGVSLRDMPEEFLVSGEVQKEDALFKIDMYSSQKLYFDMGYSTKGIEQINTSIFSNNNQYTPIQGDYWIKIWVKKERGAFIIPEEVKDFSLLLKNLRDNPSLEICYIKSLLSNRFQNILNIYPNIDEPGSYIKKIVVDELNRILQYEILYNNEIMKDTQISEFLKNSFERFQNPKSKLDYNRIGSHLSGLIYYNRELLDCILSDHIHEYGEIQVPVEAIRKHYERKMERY